MFAWAFSPSKARHQLALVVQIFLDLLPHVEDGTVPTVGGDRSGRSVSDVRSVEGEQTLRVVPSPCAENILVEGTLTALALSPQARETLLQRAQVIDLQRQAAFWKSQLKLVFDV